MPKQIRVTLKDSPILRELMERLGIDNHSQLVNYILIDYRKLIDNSSNNQGTSPVKSTRPKIDLI